MRYYNSAISPKNSSRHNKRWSTPAPRFTMCNKLRCWPPVLSLLPDKPWMPPQTDSNKRELTVPSTRTCSVKASDMSVTMKQPSTHVVSSNVNSKLEGDPHCRNLRTLTSRVTLVTFSLTLTRFLHVTRTMSPSFRTGEMTMDTEVKSRSSHLDKGVMLRSYYL